MNAGVTSRGSPMPKSITSIPRACASAFQSSSRANGYWASSVRNEVKLPALDGTEQEPLHALEESPLRLTAISTRSSTAWA